MRAVLAIVVLIIVGALIWFFAGTQPAEAPETEVVETLPVNPLPTEEVTEMPTEEEEASLPLDTDVGMEYPIPDKEY